MMSKKQSLCHDTLGNNKPNKPTLKKKGKLLSVHTAHTPSGGRSGSGAAKVRLSSRSDNSVTAGSKLGVGLKRSINHEGPKPLPQVSRPAVRLSSSRSFSSLPTSSLSAATFMRSSHSLSRLDQSFTGNETKRRKSSEKTVASDQSSSKELLSETNGKNQCRVNNLSSAVSHHSNKIKKQCNTKDVLRLPQPDLLNFKKGWLMRQDADEQWQKHWVVLTDQTLRFYKDSVAEEAADVDDEINLSTCFHITDGPAQENCSFQIHTRDGVHTLCAMTSGIRHNWVQAVLKNVRSPSTPDVTSSLPKQRTHLKSQRPDAQRPDAQSAGKAMLPSSCLDERCRGGAHETSEWADKQQQTAEEPKLQPKKEQCSSDRSSSSSPVTSFQDSITSSHSAARTQFPSSPPHQMEGGGGASCHQLPLLVGTTHTGLEDASSQDEGDESGCRNSTTMPSNDERSEKHSNKLDESQQPWQQSEKRLSKNVTCACILEKDKLEREQQTGRLVKELEETQKELSRLQQLNKNLQDELHQERESHSKDGILPQNDHSPCSSSLEQAVALQRLQKTNHELHFELEALKRSQDEAREANLRRRVDLLAQQAQLLVTGDDSALAQAHLEQYRRQFREQQVEWERCVASLKSQLSISEEKRKEAESRLSQHQQEMQGYQNLRQEADSLRKHLQEVSSKLCANEEAQAQKEARLQKHLVLLQASQDRERRSLAASLAQAEQHSQELQERLDRAEQQAENLNKSKSWTKEIQEAQQQLQEELVCTVSALRKLQEEREQLNCRCQELQNQLSEADVEVSRLQNRLKAEETSYYNLEHSYERTCEELQVALGKIRQRESETQDIREGYERLLDRKEQELSEVLLKMEILGNSLEETEFKLQETMKVHVENGSSGAEPANDNTPNTANGDLNPNPNPNPDPDPDNTNVIDVHENDNRAGHATQSQPSDPSHPHIVTAGDDPEGFLAIIQLLETKLYVTEEKLRDITQRLEEQKGHFSCQDPHLCSQLTQSRATAQHLSLLLHNQAKQSRCFAQDTEHRCRVLVGRFQVALKIVQACREKLQAREHSTPTDWAEFEKQLATVAACLQQGEKDAMTQEHEAQNVSKGEDKILKDETLAKAKSNICAKGGLKDTLHSEDDADIDRTLMRELLVVEKMISVLQSQNCADQLHLAPTQDVAQTYKKIMSRRISSNMGKDRHLASAESDNEETLECIISGACAEADLIYAALKLQHQYDGINNDEEKNLRKSCVKYDDVIVQRENLADINPSELGPYEEQVEGEATSVAEASKPLDKGQSNAKKVEKEPEWFERFISRLQKRAKFLHNLCQEICDSSGKVSVGSVNHECENGSAVDLNWVQEHAKLIYLTDRLYSDFEHELQRKEMLLNKLQVKCKEDATLIREQEAFNRALIQLREDNSVLKVELECAEQKIISAENGNQRLLEEIQEMQDYHEERMQKLETEFHEKIKELQLIHEDEMKHMHSYYTKSAPNSEEKNTKSPNFRERTTYPPEQTQNPPENGIITERTNSRVTLSSMDSNKRQPNELEMKTKEDLGNQMAGEDAMDYKNIHIELKDFCERSSTAVEEMHVKLMSNLQQQHQQEVAALLMENDQLLQEETAATMAALAAMGRTHKEELEKNKRCQHIRESANITQLHAEYEKEIQLLYKELEVLSLQHTKKCLENSQLSQDLQDERKALLQYQKENLELKKKQKETNEMSHARSSLNDRQPHVSPQTNEHSDITVNVWRTLKNKFKADSMSAYDIPQHGDTKRYEDFNFTNWPSSRENSTQEHKAITTNRNDSGFLKKTSLTRQVRGMRSKSLKEGLSAQERMKLFES